MRISSANLFAQKCRFRLARERGGVVVFGLSDGRAPAAGGRGRRSPKKRNDMSAWPFPSFRFAAAAVAALLSFGNARAADFYVTTTGSDAGDGSQATPFATIGAAVAAADAAIAGGETDATIHVAAGTYIGSGHVLTNAIAVVGAGADNTVVDGNGGYRVFSLGSSDAALKGLCVSNGMFAAAGDRGSSPTTRRRSSGTTTSTWRSR